MRRIPAATRDGRRSNTRILAGLIAALTLVFALLCLHALDTASSAKGSPDASSGSLIVTPQVDDNPVLVDGLVGCAVAGLACGVGLLGLVLSRLTGASVHHGGAVQKAPSHHSAVRATRAVLPARPFLHALGILRT